MALGVLLVLATVRFFSLKVLLNSSSETNKRKKEEASMAINNRKAACSALVETTWAFGVAVASGLALLS